MSSETVSFELRGKTAVLALASPPVNALGAALRDGLRRRLGEVEADPAVAAVVIYGAGRLFCAGADISEFGGPRGGVELGALVDFVEASSKPVVAAIHGQALGGGLELALGCHYRLATASGKLGLPEVKLGIVPGAGGTQRLPRCVGPERALAMIALGEPISALEGLDLGLVDEIVDESRLVEEAVAFAERLVAQDRGPRRLRDRDELVREAGADGLFDGFRKANARRFRGREAPEAAIACVEAALRQPFAEGLAFERDACVRLMAGEQSIAQRHAFFAEREAGKILDLPADAKPRPIGRVGVIGAGTMGGGIAMNFLNAGVPVTIVEAREEALERGVGVIRTNYAATAKKGRISPEGVESRMALLTPSLDMADLAGCDLVIEAVFEDMDLKRRVFTTLDGIMPQGAILASNTSFLDLDEIAAVTKRPQDVVGLHFFSPANVMRLLEVVRGAKTAPDVLATAMALARTIGKVAICVGVCPGFVANRLLRPRQREAQALVLEGATPWAVDRVLETFGMPVGPFAMDDIVGLDLGWSRETSAGTSVRDILCERDRRGQKTSAGYYDYDERRKATPSREVEQVIAEVAEKRGVARREIGDDEMLERCLYPMVNEGAKILEEGKALRASDIDVAWLAGFGWPAHRGGPMHWGETVGLAKIVERLRAYERDHGPEFRPSALLAKLAEEGGRFSDFGATKKAA